MGTRQARGFDVSTQTAADTPHAIGDDRFAVAGAAEDDTSFEFTASNCLSDWPNEDRIVYRLS